MVDGIGIILFYLIGLGWLWFKDWEFWLWEIWIVAEDINNDICCFVGKIILSYSINNLTMYQITLNSQSNPIQMLPIANTFKPIIQFWPIQSILILPTFQFSNSLSFFNGFLFLKTLLYYKHHIKLFYLCLLLLLINESTRIPDSSVRF